jgi:hypothetical protein
VSQIPSITTGLLVPDKVAGTLISKGLKASGQLSMIGNEVSVWKDKDGKEEEASYTYNTRAAKLRSPQSQLSFVEHWSGS